MHQLAVHCQTVRHENIYPRKWTEHILFRNVNMCIHIHSHINSLAEKEDINLKNREHYKGWEESKKNVESKKYVYI